jgi:hypothetical protein
MTQEQNKFTDQQYKDWTDYIETITQTQIRTHVAKLLWWVMFSDCPNRPDYKQDKWVEWKCEFINTPLVDYLSTVTHHLMTMCAPARVISHAKKTLRQIPTKGG